MIAQERQMMSHAVAQQSAIHQQVIQELYQAQNHIRVDLESYYSRLKSELPRQLAAEVDGARQALQAANSMHEKLEGLAAHRAAVDAVTTSRHVALQAQASQMLAFDGSNLLQKGGEDYPAQLAHRSQGNTQLARELHEVWKASYQAGAKSPFLQVGDESATAKRS